MTSDGALALVRASDVKREPVDWFWNGRLAAGKITLLLGDPGVGKTTLALSLAAAISQGDPLPGEDGSRPSRDVLVFSGEDDPGDTLRPRLEAAQANLHRVVLHDIRDPGAIPLSLPRDIAALEQVVVEHHAGLLIIDPVMSFLDQEINSHKDQEVRRALTPLASMGQRTGCAVLLLMHLNKDSSKAAIYRGGGSIAFTGLARIVLLAATDPEDPETCVLVRVKGNLGRHPKAMTYSIGSVGDSSQIRWGGASEHTAETLLVPEKPGPSPDKIEAAKRYITDLLASGPRSRREVMELCAKVGIPVRTADRAAVALSVVSEASGRERVWKIA